MGNRLRAFLWAAIALLVAVLPGGALPRSRRSPLDAPGLIGYLYVNEGTLDRDDPGADNVVAGFAAFADGALALLPGSPWPTGACSAFVDVRLLEVRSSEPDDAPGSGDGRTTGDVDGVDPGDDRDVLLRAERSNTGAGRTYTLTYRLTDAAGNTRALDVPVVVPRTLTK